MKNGLKGSTHKYLAVTALIIWFILNLMTLTTFPALHSDETWLSGLTMEMLQQGRPDVTEPFFDLYPRHPHALKLIYHLLQLPFLLMGGYGSFPVRLLSLFISALCLPLFYRLLRKFEEKADTPNFALMTTILMAVDIQFITAAHTGRQEILLLLVQLLTIRLYLGSRNPETVLFTGLVTGMAAGIHPNAFILAWTPGLLFLTDIIFRRRKPAEGLFFLAGGLLGAGLFVSLSFLFNPNFIRDYLAYGSPLGVTRSIDEKALQLPRFINQLFRRIAGTYYLPDIRPQILLYPAILIPPLFFTVKRLVVRFRRKSLLARGEKALTEGEDRVLIWGTAGTAAGIIIIGKYSQPSVLFFLPFLYMGVHRLFRLCPRSVSRSLSGVLALILLLFSLQNIREEIFPLAAKESYKEFQNALREALPGEEKILGGLNTAYAFEHGRLLDYRNLAHLRERDLSFEDYVRDREIGYIIHTEELDFIYESRPVWNALNGNPSHWYPQFMKFIAENCEETALIPSPSYGTRIQAYRYSRTWPLRIYRVLPPSESSE